jgi:ABC-2 type transport system ATP-binding protein
MRDSVVLVEGLSKTLGRRSVVRDLSMRVERGDVYGFLGANGAGKTTTLRLLVGLLRADAGSVVIHGANLGARPMAALEHIGALVEMPRFHEGLSALTNLRLGARLIPSLQGNRRAAEHRIQELLDVVGLAGRETDRVSTYSLGMKQRLGIANALLGSPPIVILDEPTNGLDPQGMVEIRRLVAGLAEREGTTVIVSSHLLTEVEAMCNRVGIIANGTMVAEGAVDELCGGSPRCVVHTTDPGRAARVIESHASGRVVSCDADRVVVELDDSPPSALNEALVRAGVPVDYLVPTRQALESVFMELTGGEDVA